ncbi:response regulator [Nitrincola iocasae]|jgi:CheY-like chemotaxis protein|uniref:Response regulator n=1 Tax=Nitrincola iocasae TaxID=2614693 RepID=A0A5J6LC27_9GAMM|nr:response regulator [Nitrincola iocasae]QEW05838.1 response regulator [Nitrincola iocasae]
MIDKPSLFRVLLVEDEPADAHLIRLAFEENNLLVDLRHVSDGVEAFSFLRRQSGYSDEAQPDLILLDLNMPRMNGLQFLEKIKQEVAFRHIPVVVLTTSDSESDIIRSYDLGASGYVVKPVDIDDFIHQVKTLEDYWITLVRRPQKPG